MSKGPRSARKACVALVGQRDDLDAAVGGVAGPVTSRRPSRSGDGSASPRDADRLGQLALRAWPADLQVEQDQPDREAAARLRQGLVEGAADGAGRLVQAQPEWGREKAPACRQGNTTLADQEFDI